MALGSCRPRIYASCSGFRFPAARPAYEVVLLCRNAEKARAAAADIRRRTGNDRVRAEIVDLARRDSIFSLAGRWEGPVHVLVNNAATSPRRREETPEGIELQLATDVLGYFWTMTAFRDHLTASAPASDQDSGSFGGPCTSFRRSPLPFAPRVHGGELPVQSGRSHS